MTGAGTAAARGRGPSITAGLSAGRIAIGAASLFMPMLAARVMSFPRGHVNPSTVMLGRLFGAREMALGVVTLRALQQRGCIGRPLAAMNAAVDLADTVTCASVLASRRGPNLAAVMSLALAVPYVVGWAAVIAEG